MHLLAGAVLAFLLYYFFVVKPPKAPEKEDTKVEKQIASGAFQSFDPTGGGAVGPDTAGMSPAGANLSRPINKTREVLGQVQKRNEE